MNPTVARNISVRGIVQGVGFRPFVFQLARSLGLTGEVANTDSGVAIHLQGPLCQIEAFCDQLVQNSPPLAHITDIQQSESVPGDYATFLIASSQSGQAKTALISPDTAVCEDCLNELFDPGNRRYHYPFINCTNCGPRYTIIDAIPYDRPKTSMRHFTMCARCQAEYDDPGNRRFHAQPNACPDCGPQVMLCDAKGRAVSGADPIKNTVALLKSGSIVAIKGLGGFHLAVDGQNDAAVRRLRARKHREEKPFALMAPDLATMQNFARVSEAEARLLTSIQRPIVLVKKRDPNLMAPSVSPENRYFGVMLPYTPLHYLLLKHTGFQALVMTSANRSEEPIAIANNDAFARLVDITDYLLVHNREIYLRSDDSIMCHTAGAPRVIRRSRGLVPVPIFLEKGIEPVLACGGELKNTICLTRGRAAFLSQHIGDLENLAAEQFFRETVSHMKRILDVNPRIVAHDLHPDYLSTRYADTISGATQIGVQHHHAHIVSCLAENRVEGPVIGLAFDGTGFGADGKIWGGEVLVADTRGFERVAHLAYVPMPGSAAAIRQPWRMAVSYLLDAFGPGFAGQGLTLLETLGEKPVSVVCAMIQKGINAPETSSLGRLFDGVAAIIGLHPQVAFEGQAAMALETVAAREDQADDGYEFFWHKKNPRLIPTRPLIQAIVKDLCCHVSPAVISARFHKTLIRLFTGLCLEIGKERHLDRIALSGGVFQNRLLLTGLTRSLQAAGFFVYSHRLVPTNDGGISLGQAVVAGKNAGAMHQ